MGNKDSYEQQASWNLIYFASGLYKTYREIGLPIEQFAAFHRVAQERIQNKQEVLKNSFEQRSLYNQLK